MCSCVQKKKEHLGSGNFKYTFECQDNIGTTKTVTVTSGNDNQAKQLAELECEEKAMKIVTNRNEISLKNNLRFITVKFTNILPPKTLFTFHLFH